MQKSLKAIFMVPICIKYILLKNFRTSISTLLTMLISATLKEVLTFVRVELKLAKHFPSILMKLFFKKSLEKNLVLFTSRNNDRFS